MFCPACRNAICAISGERKEPTSQASDEAVVTAGCHVTALPLCATVADLVATSRRRLIISRDLDALHAHFNQMALLRPRRRGGAHFVSHRLQPDMGMRVWEHAAPDEPLTCHRSLATRKLPDRTVGKVQWLLRPHSAGRQGAARIQQLHAAHESSGLVHGKEEFSTFTARKTMLCNVGTCMQGSIPFSCTSELIVFEAQDCAPTLACRPKVVKFEASKPLEPT